MGDNEFSILGDGNYTFKTVSPIIKKRVELHQKKRTKAINFRPFVGVRCGARTHDTQNHNLVLYQLN